MKIQISWLQKPTDLDPHCLQRQGISELSRTRVNSFPTTTLGSSIKLPCKNHSSVQSHVKMCLRAAAQSGQDLHCLLIESFGTVKHDKVSKVTDQAWANSVDSDEMPQSAASHQGLHCFPEAECFYFFHFFTFIPVPLSSLFLFLPCPSLAELYHNYQDCLTTLWCDYR